MARTTRYVGPHGQALLDDRAHEADMRALRKEQLAAEEWEAEHDGYPEDEPFEWDNNV